jgi:hypothetical protein
MAERTRDKDDLVLESLFHAEPVPDNGFSARVVSRVRHRMWARRLALPLALALGFSISAKPLLQFLGALPGILNAVFGTTLSLESLPAGALPDLSTMLFGASALMAALLASRLLEE